MAKRKHRFSADRPIDDIPQDRLGRSHFAAKLAEAVCSWKEKDSLVLALYGGWGSGKTSLKNLFKRHCSRNGNPYIVEFNPWQWSGQDKIFDAFFQQIGVRLGKTDVAAKSAKLAKKWKYFAASWGFASELISQLKQTITACLAFGATITAWASTVEKLESLRWLLFAGAAVLAITSVVMMVPGLFEKVAGLFEARSAYLQKSTEEIRDELFSELQKLDKPVVVIIDDIDRLNQDEIRLVFQLVKANSDLPRMVFVLLFQNDVVVQALDKITLNRGSEYLKKLVQVGFDLPKASETKLYSALFDGLNEIFEDAALNRRWDKERWNDIFFDYLKPYFQTLRDVYRFLGTLEFHVSIHFNKGVLEVNPVDLIAIEVVRVFEHDIYDRLKASSLAKGDRFLETLLGVQEREKKVRILVEEVLVGIDEGPRREQLQSLIYALFPQANTKFSGRDENWDKELRICHENHFSKYFELTLPDDKISAQEISLLLESINDRDSMMTKLGLFAERGQIQQLLTRLESYMDEVAPSAEFIASLFEFGERLPEAGPGFFELDPIVQATRLVRRVVKRIGGQEERAKLLLEAMSKSNAVVVPVVVTDSEIRRPEREQLVEGYLIPEESVATLKELCAKRILATANEGRLQNSRHLVMLLNRWMMWGNKDAAKDWLNQIVHDQTSALAFLTSLISKVKISKGIGPGLTEVRPVLYLKIVEQFMDVERLEKLLTGVVEATLDDTQRSALSQFRTKLDLKRKGQPYDETEHWEN